MKDTDARFKSALLFALAQVVLMAHGHALAADDVDVVANAIEGSGVAITARATLAAPHEVIWQTLTDYDNLADFIPGMKSSRIVDWRGKTPVVEQEGTARILFFRYPIHVTVEAILSHPDRIDVRLVKGNLKRLTGGYRIEKSPDGPDRYILKWSGVIEPEFPLPDAIGVPLMRVNIADQFIGMVGEIERRAAARTAAAPGARDP